LRELNGIIIRNNNGSIFETEMKIESLGWMDIFFEFNMDHFYDF